MKNIKILLIQLFLWITFVLSLLFLIVGIVWNIILGIQGAFEWYGNSSLKSLITIFFLIACPFWGLFLFPTKKTVNALCTGATFDDWGESPSAIILSLFLGIVPNLPAFFISLISFFNTYRVSPISLSVNIFIFIQSIFYIIIIIILLSVLFYYKHLENTQNKH